MSFDPFTAGFDLIKTGLDKVFPDADTELKGKLEQAAKSIDAELQIKLAQLAINQEEAKSPSRFIAGGRAFMVWVGGLSISYQLLIMPILNGVLVAFGKPAAFVGVDIAQLKPIIGALLGF